MKRAKGLAIEHLPFIAVKDPTKTIDDPERLDYWRVQETHDSERDWLAGRLYAETATQNELDFLDPQPDGSIPPVMPVGTLTARVLATIMSKGRVGPIEQGFIQRIAEYAACSIDARNDPPNSTNHF